MKISNVMVSLDRGAAAADRVQLSARLAERFAPVLGRALPVDGLALFIEDEAGAPFRVHALHSLSPASPTSLT